MEDIEIAESESNDSFKWYAVRAASNQELKIKRYLEHLIESEDYGQYIKSVLVPNQTVMEVKNGKKTNRIAKDYPGYVFVFIKSCEEDKEAMRQICFRIGRVPGVLGFIGGSKDPIPLKKNEIDGILRQAEETKGKKVLKVAYEVGENVRISNGPFLNSTGKIDEIDAEKGKLKISVSMFGRFTPVELEYWQVQKEG